MKRNLRLSAFVALALVAAGCRHFNYSDVQKCLLAEAGLRPAAAATAEFVPGEVLVTWAAPAGGSLNAAPAADDAPGQDEAQLRAFATDHGLRILAVGTDILPARLATAEDPVATATRLEADPRVRHAEPNWIFRTQQDMPCSEQLWHLAGFGVPGALDIGPGRNEVVVAVIDTGVDVDHPELAAAALPGWNFRHDTDTPHDPRPGNAGARAAHGTHVAGIVVARGDDPDGATGVAGFPNQIRLLPVRIFDDAGEQATFADLLNALYWSAGMAAPNGSAVNRHPAGIINLSLGGGTAQNAMLNEAVAAVTQAGILVVAASGNNSPGILAPANGPDALAVGSTDDDYERSAFSAYGGSGQIGIMGPGGRGPSTCGMVVSTLPGGGFGCMEGTSMAAPFVAGAAALLLTHEPDLGPAELVARLEAATYYDEDFMNAAEYGAGVLCVERLLLQDAPGPAQTCAAGSP